MILLLAISLTAPQEPPPTKAEPSAPPPRVIPAQGRSTIVMEARQRSDDLMKAYDFLKKDKPTLRISAQLASGALLANVSEIIPMPNGTLFLVKFSTPQGTNCQLVSVDDLTDLRYAP